MADNQIRVDELLGREMAIQWFEAVALIQAVCRLQLERESGDVFPTASEILLGFDGTVACHQATGRSAVTTAARLLSRMLGQDVPVRLRLVVAQATASDAVYPNLSEFSNALAYFERPDGHSLLQGLAERARVSPMRLLPAAEDPNAASLQQSAAQPLPERPQSRAHLRLVVGAAVSAACVFAGLLGASAVDYGRLEVAFSSLTSAGSSSASPASSPAKPKTTAVGTVGGATSGTRREATRTSAPAARAGAGSTAGRLAERTTDRPTAARPSARRDPLQVAALLPLIPMWASPVSPAAEYRPVFGETVEVTATEAGAEDEVTATGARIFTRADAGVVPPRSVYPKLPSDSLNASEPDNRTILELVIGSNGLVERAKLRSIPRDIHEFMLVSAAKAWIFEPATIDGLAVRYRHQVRIMLP